jgi:hypothetical protein
MDELSDLPCCNACAAPMEYIGMLSGILARPAIFTFKCTPCGNVRSFTDERLAAIEARDPVRQMFNYEARILSQKSSVVDVRRFQCATDTEAKGKARDFIQTLAVELWCDGRLVGRLPPKIATVGGRSEK